MFLPNLGAQIRCVKNRYTAVQTDLKYLLVSYLFPLLSSIYQFILLIINYKGFTLFVVTYPINHHWFYVLRYNSDMSKFEWTLLLFNFNYICDLTNRRRLICIPVAKYVSFLQIVRLKTNIRVLISKFSKYYFKTDNLPPFLIFTCIYRFRIW